MSKVQNLENVQIKPTETNLNTGQTHTVCVHSKFTAKFILEIRTKHTSGLKPTQHFPKTQFPSPSGLMQPFCLYHKRNLWPGSAQVRSMCYNWHEGRIRRVVPPWGTAASLQELPGSSPAERRSNFFKIYLLSKIVVLQLFHHNKAVLKQSVFFHWDLPFPGMTLWLMWLTGFLLPESESVSWILRNLFPSTPPHLHDPSPPTETQLNHFTATSFPMFPMTSPIPARASGWLVTDDASRLGVLTEKKFLPTNLKKKKS